MATAEDFMLLAMRDDAAGGPLIGNLPLECGLAAAILMELVDAGRIDTTGDRVVVRDPAPVGVAELDDVLARIVTEQAHDLGWWVRSARSGLYGRFLAKLVARGVVTQQRGRVLGIFPTSFPRLADTTAGHELRDRLEAVLGAGAADPRDVVLLAIVYATGLDRMIFPTIAADVVERRVRQLGEDALAAAVTEVVRQVRAAVMAAVTAAV